MCLSFILLIIIKYISISNEHQPTSPNHCVDLIKASIEESELIAKLAEHVDALLSYESTHSERSSCIEPLLTSGNYLALESYLELLNKHGIAYRDNLSNAINNVESKLRDIHNKFRFGEQDYQKVLPSFQWAQSIESIFIEVKFAHRHDSPGCLEMSKLSLNLTNSSMSLRAYCVLGDVPIKFDLNLDFFEEIDVDNCTYGSGSVGRYQINLKKKDAMYWKQLAINESLYYPNMRIWFEMKSKYEEEMKEYEWVDEEEELKLDFENAEREFKEKRGKRRKRRKKTTKKKDKKDKAKIKGNGKGKGKNKRRPVKNRRQINKNKTEL